jgi:hypothetical protein
MILAYKNSSEIQVEGVHKLERELYVEQMTILPSRSNIDPTTSKPFPSYCSMPYFAIGSRVPASAFRVNLRVARSVPGS